MILFSKNGGFTKVEIIVLLFIGVILSGVMIPKMRTAAHMRKCIEFPIILTRIFDAEYEYHKKTGSFTDNLTDLTIEPPIKTSKWWTYSIEFANADSFFVKAKVKQGFGKVTTDDWAGIDNHKNHSISNIKTLGKYDIEWMRKKKLKG